MAAGDLSFGTGRALVALLRNACSGAMCELLDGAFGHPLPVEERCAASLAGGILRHGRQCGMVWGAALAAGAHAYRLAGAGAASEARAIAAAARLVQAFRAQNGAVNCVDLTGMDRGKSALQVFGYFFLQGGSLRCAHRTSRYAPLALAVVDDALPPEEGGAAPAPASCAALLLRRLGCGEEQAVMAAGLAGGIGLSGGGCGALGAAVWVLAQRRMQAGAASVDPGAPLALEVVERFRAASGGELDCERIVGRRFEGVADHARHLREGGCARILDALVEALGPAPVSSGRGRGTSSPRTRPAGP